MLVSLPCSAATCNNFAFVFGVYSISGGLFSSLDIDKEMI
jgi:hypothetical protein